jgi:hypothetical protein
MGNEVGGLVTREYRTAIYEAMVHAAPDVLALAAPAVQARPLGYGGPRSLMSDAPAVQAEPSDSENNAYLRDHPAAQSADAVDAMHRAIMNIPCEPLTGLAFRLGHRAALRAAAEIVLSQSAAAAKETKE